MSAYAEIEFLSAYVWHTCLPAFVQNEHETISPCRLWLDRTLHCLTHEINSAMLAQEKPMKEIKLLDSSRREILPDDVLQRVMDCGLYVAIKSKMAPPKRHGRSDQYCIRSWLGLSGSPQDWPDVQVNISFGVSFFTHA